MDYKKHVEFFFLSLICGIAATGVSFVAKMTDNSAKTNENIVQLTIAVREIKATMELNNSKFNESIHDHESRIRSLESGNSYKK